MDGLRGMNHALQYVEENITREIDFSEVAKRAMCSEHHFRRMFASLSGISLTEYVRRRRLTLAAFALRESQLRIIDVAIE